MHDEDAAATVLGDRRGDAAEEHFREAGPAARADHDHAGVELIRGGDDLLPGARGDLDTRLGRESRLTGEPRPLFGHGDGLVLRRLLYRGDGRRIDRGPSRQPRESDLVERLADSEDDRAAAWTELAARLDYRARRLARSVIGDQHG